MKKYIVGLGLIVAISGKVSGHGIQYFAWATINTFGLYDARNNQVLPAFDANVSYVFFNGGVSYKNINYTEAGKLSYYAGAGIGSWLQLQAGFSKDGFSIRNRYDWQIGYFFSKNIGFARFITVSPVVERYFKNPQMKWYFGVGIGCSINLVYGFSI